MTTLTREKILELKVIYDESMPQLSEMCRLALEALAVRESGIVEILESVPKYQWSDVNIQFLQLKASESLAKYDEMKGRGE